MKNFIKSIFACALLLTGPAASATSWSQYYVYFARLHFSERAFGKQVREVYAHAGVLRQTSSCQGEPRKYWHEVKHIKMAHRNDHFFAKTLFSPSTGECQPLVLGPVVQYWVYFTDGTSMITKEEMIPLQLRNSSSYDDYKYLRSSIGDVYLQTDDAAGTFATGYGYGYAS